MSSSTGKYCNARFKSPYFVRTKAPKTGIEHRAPSKPTRDQTVKGLLPQSRKKVVHLTERSSHMAEKIPKALLFQKEHGQVAFDSLRSAELRVESAVPAFVAREIPNTNFRNVGTVRVLAKPKPLVQHVGSIENHPRNKIDEELMEQRALRNMADLPTLLDKLRQIGNPAPQHPQRPKLAPEATTASHLDLPPPPPKANKISGDSKDDSDFQDADSGEETLDQGGMEQQLSQRLDRLVELVSGSPQEEVTPQEETKSEGEDGFVKVDDSGLSVDTEEVQNSLKRADGDGDDDDDTILNTEVIKNVLKKATKKANQDEIFKKINRRVSHHREEIDELIKAIKFISSSFRRKSSMLSRSKCRTSPS